ncbi:MAG: TRAP transporter substrate-binding protein [Caulobacterales bacterium]|uniref:TRAP transporter substrate-binding protein n=1 Tax=Glycocaulis sp. TaxID=1969725 RepID=UPI003F9F3932
MLKRREFLAVAAMAATGSLAGCGRRDDPPGSLYGRAVAQAPPRTPWDAQWLAFEARMAENETLRIDYFTKAELGNEERMLHDLRRGRAHIGGMSLQGLASSIPELSIALAPYLFESNEEVDYVYDNHLYDIINELALAQNLILLQWVEVGWTHIFANRPLLVPSDAAGLKIRTSPNAAARFFCEAAGMDAIALGISDVIPALQTGLVEGGLSSLPFHFFSTLEMARDFTLTRHSFDTGAIVLNRDWYERATASQRETIDQAWGSSADARAGVRAMTGMLEGAMRSGVMRGPDGNVVRELRTSQGEPIAVHDLDPAQRAAWRQATENVVDRLVDDAGGRSREVYEAILAGKAAFAARQTGGDA